MELSSSLNIFKEKKLDYLKTISNERTKMSDKTIDER